MKQFKGEIAGKKLTDFNKFDNKISKFEDRLAFINEVLGDGEFFAQYFDNYYDVSPSQTGYLAEDNAVCMVINHMGTFLIESLDIKSNRKVEYKFWVNEREYREYKESKNVSASPTDENGKEVEVIDMFVDKKNSKNQTIVKPYSINSKDSKDIEEIKQLAIAIEFLKSPAGVKSIKDHVKRILEQDIVAKEDQDKLQYILKNTERYVDSYVKDLRDSQLIIKKAIKRPIEFKAIMKGEGVANKLDEALMSDEAVNKLLLTMIGNEEDLMSDIGIMVYDFKCLINRIKFPKREGQIIDLFKQGYKQKELPDVLGIDKKTVSNSMSRIVKRIAEFYVKDLYEKSKIKH